MKVLIATSTFARFPGDPTAAHGNALYDLARELGKSVEGTIVTHSRSGAPAVEQLGGLTVRRIGPERPEESLTRAWTGARAPRVARIAWAMRNSVRELAADHDLVHAFWFFPGGWSIAGLDMPRVMTVPGGIETYPSYPVIGARVKRIVRETHVCVGVDDSGRAILAELGAPRAECIPSPVNLDLFPMSPSAAGSKLLFVGRLGHEKGVDVALKGLAIARATRPGMTLEIVGDGPERDALEKLVAELGLQGSVTFHGARSQDEIAPYIAASTALVLSSRREGLPSAALEALACGRPVVASAVGGLPTLLTNDRGITVPPENPAAFAEAFIAACDRTWDVRALRAAAESYAVSRAAASYVDLYRNLLDARTAAA